MPKYIICLILILNFSPVFLCAAPGENLDAQSSSVSGIANTVPFYRLTEKSFREYIDSLQKNGLYREAADSVLFYDSLFGGKAKAFFEAASLYKLMEKPDSAVALFDSALSEDPEMSSAVLEKALLLGKNGEHGRAASEFLRCSKMRGRDTVCLRLAADNYMAFADTVGLFEVCSEIISLNSMEVKCRKIRADFFMDRGKCDSAMPELEALTAVDPENFSNFVSLAECLEKDGKNHEALKKYEQAVMLDPGRDSLYLHVGRLALRTGDTLSALESYVDFLKRCKDDDSLFALAAALFEHTGDKRKALSYYKRAIDKNPDLIKYRRQTARLLMLRGDTAEAVLHYHVVHDSMPKEIKPSYELGMYYYKKEKFPWAAEFLEEVYVRDTSLDSSMPDVSPALFESFFRTGQYDRAVNLFSSVFPRTFNDYLMQGLSYYRMDSIDKAAEIFDTCYTMAPEKLISLKEAGFAFYHAGDYKKALEVLEAVQKDSTDTASYRILGELYRREGEFDKAASAYRALTESIDDGGHISVLILAGLLEKIKDPEAVSYYRKYLEKHPDNPAALKGLNRLYKYKDMLYERSVILKTLIEVFPDSVRFRKDYADVLSAQNLYEKALLEYEKIIASDSASEGAFPKAARLLYELGKYQRTLDFCRRAMNPGNESPVLLKFAGASLLALGEYHEAADYLERAHLVIPEDRELLIFLEKLWEKRGKRDKLLEVRKKLVNLDRTNISAILFVADESVEEGDTAAAVELYNKVLEVDRINTQGFRQLARIYFHRGQYAKSLAFFRELMRAGETEWQDNYMLGLIYRAGQKQKEAAAALEKASEQNPVIDTLHVLLGEIYYSLGAYMKSLKAYRRAVSAGGEYRKYRYEMAAIYLELGQTTSAGRQIYGFLEDYPESVRGYKLLADVYLSARDYRSAVEPLEALREYDRNDEDVNEKLAVASFRAGFYEKALSLYKEFYIMNPDSAALAEKLADCYLRTGDTLNAGMMYAELYSKKGYVFKKRPLASVIIYKAGLIGTGVAALRETVRRQVRLPEIFETLYSHYSQKGDYDSAAVFADSLFRYSNSDSNALKAAAAYDSINNTDMAALRYREYFRSQPGDTAVLLRLMEIYDERDQRKMADSLLPAALKLFPADPDYLYRFAVINLQKNERRNAQKNLMKAIQSDSMHTPSLVLLSEMKMQEKRYEEAEKLIRAAMDAGAGGLDRQLSKAMFFNGKTDSAYDLMKEIISGKSFPEQYGEFVLMAFKSDTLEHNLYSYVEKNAASIKTPGFLFMTARSAYTDSAYLSAESMLNRYRELNGKDRRALILSADIYSTLGKHKKEYEVLQDIPDISEKPELLLRAAGAAEKSGLLKDAVVFYFRYLEMRRGDIDTALKTASILAELPPSGENSAMMKKIFKNYIKSGGEKDKVPEKYR
ncbi:MAG: tetratricopeptide repeat protein [Fibrobacterota bacterium]